MQKQLTQTEKRRVRQNLSPERKRQIKEQQGYRCARCGKHCPPNWKGESELDVHHRRRVADGGSNGRWNLQALCKSCHSNNHSFDQPTHRPESETPVPEDQMMNYGNNRGGGTTTQEQEYRVVPESDLQWNTPSSEPHPVGLYKLALVKVEPFFDEETGQAKAKMIFHSEEEMDNGNPWPISCKTKASFHPRSNAGKFLMARGEDLKALNPANFRLSEYERGKPKFGYVMGNIVHEPRMDGQGVYAKIESFAPMPKQGRKQREETPEEDPFVKERAVEEERAAKKRKALEEDDED